MKKLNNRGWGLSDYLIIVTAIIAALIIASLLIIHLTKNLNKNFNTEIENEEPTNIIENNNDSSALDKEEIENKEIDYKSLENKLITIGEKYVELNYKGNINNGTIIVDNQHIIDLDSSIKNEMEKDSCKGYVIIKKETETISYTPYISCNNYKSEGYLDIYN